MKQVWNYSIICFSQSADTVHWVYYTTLSQLRPNTGPFPVRNLLYCLSAFFNQTKGSFQFNYTLNSSACRARGSRYHWCTSPPFIMPLGSPTDPEAWCISLSLSLIISPSMLMTQRLMPGQNWAPIFRAPPCLQFYTVYKYLWTHTDS